MRAAVAGRPAGSGRPSSSVLACRQLSSGRLRSELGRGGLAPLTATAKRSGGSVPAAAADAKYVQFDKGLRQGRRCKQLTCGAPWSVGRGGKCVSTLKCAAGHGMSAASRWRLLLLPFCCRWCTPSAQCRSMRGVLAARPAVCRQPGVGGGSGGQMHKPALTSARSPVASQSLPSFAPPAQPSNAAEWRPARTRPSPSSAWTTCSRRRL